MPDMNIQREVRAYATAWRDKEKITLYMRGAELSASIELTPEEATALGEKLIGLAMSGPRIGTAADLGCDVL